MLSNLPEGIQNAWLNSSFKYTLATSHKWLISKDDTLIWPEIVSKGRMSESSDFKGEDKYQKVVLKNCNGHSWTEALCQGKNIKNLN